MKNVTLKEVAKEAGVSVMSVSKALNNKEGLSDETRRRILEIAAQMNYSQNQVACSLRTGATRTIGVVLSDSAESVVRAYCAGSRTKRAETATASSSPTPTSGRSWNMTRSSL